MKKSSLIIIITASILVLAIGVFAVLYFTTDVFKSNQQLFYKYLSEIDFKEFESLNDYGDYGDRLQKETYEANGEIKLEIASNNEKISESVEYSAAADPQNKKASAELNFDIGGDKLAVNYLRNDDLYGINFADIVREYVVIENNNLKEFATKLGIQDTSSIPDRIDLSEYVNTKELNEKELKKTEEDLSKIYNKYLDIIIKQIPKDNYSKTKNEVFTVDGQQIKGTTYILTLDIKTMQSVIVKVLETAKGDEDLYNLVSKFKKEDEFTFQKYQETLEEGINSINNAENVDNKELITVKLYTANKKLLKAGITLNVEEGNKLELALEKAEKKIIVTYDLESSSYYFTQKSNSILTMEKISDSEINIKYETIVESGETKSNTSYNLSINENPNSQNLAILFNIKSSSEFEELNLDDNSNLTNNIDFEASMNIDFKDNVNISEFNDENSLVINGLEAEQIQMLFTNLGKAIQERVDFSKTLTGTLLSVNNALFDSSREAVLNTESALEEEANLLNDAAKDMFNQRLEIYEGKQRGTNVKALISAIETINQTDEESNIEYTNLEIDNNKQYNVSFSYDDAGYITKANIKED